MPLLFLDTETSGLDAVRYDILDLAYAVHPDNIPMPPQTTVHHYNLAPYSSFLDPAALQVNGYEVDQVLHFPDPTDTLHAFLAHLDTLRSHRDEKFILVAHNAPFDRSFLDSWAIKAGWADIFNSYLHRYYADTCALTTTLRVLGKMPGIDSSALAYLTRELPGLSTSCHTAVSDVSALWGLFRWYQSVLPVLPTATVTPEETVALDSMLSSMDFDSCNK